MKLEDIRKPTLIINKFRCLANIKFMAEKAAANNLIFRPHFKTHQSAEIGDWFREFNVDKITVSSVTMAQYFAEKGWNDITIAFPANILEIDEINRLAGSINLNLLIESAYVADFLIKNLRHPAGVFIKIDTGNKRTGIPYSSTDLVKDLCDKISSSEKLFFRGLLVHSGETYKAADKKHISDIHKLTIKRLNVLKDSLPLKNENIIISIGDTPACTIEESFNGVDEIRPGNFVFYDVMQYKIGVCESKQIAVCLACPVVALHKDRNELVVYGGAVHLSKDSLIDEQGNNSFGLIVKLTDTGWSEPLNDCYVKSVSQEHGIIKMSEKEIENFNPGDLLGILPVHSCLSADLMKEYISLDNTKIGKLI